MAGTLEVLHRTWHVEDRSVRPDHRMVGHTGFLTTARLLRPEELGSRPGGPVGWTPAPVPVPTPEDTEDGATDGGVADDPAGRRWPEGDGLG
jgi:hypothetical protein